MTIWTDDGECYEDVEFRGISGGWLFASDEGESFAVPMVRVVEVDARGDEMDAFRRTLTSVSWQRPTTNS